MFFDHSGIMVLFKRALVTVELNHGNLYQDCGVGRFIRLRLRLQLLEFIICQLRFSNKGSSIMQNTIYLKYNLTGRSRHSSRHCSVSANAIASQLVRNGKYRVTQKDAYPCFIR